MTREKSPEKKTGKKQKRKMPRASRALEITPALEKEPEKTDLGNFPPHAKDVLSLMEKRTKNHPPVPTVLLPYVLGIESLPKYKENATTEEEKHANERSVFLASEMSRHAARISTIREQVWEKIQKESGKPELEHILSDIPEHLKKYVVPSSPGHLPDPIPDESRDDILAQLAAHKYIFGLPVAIAIEREYWVTPKDMPSPTSQEKQDILEHPFRVDAGLVRFATQIRTTHFKDPEVERFAHVFANELQGSLGEAMKDQTRKRTLNAYWALVSFGILKERRHPESGSFEGHEIDGELLEEHLESFMALERERRATKKVEALDAHTSDETRGSLNENLLAIRRSASYRRLQERLLPVQNVNTTQAKLATIDPGQEREKNGLRKDLASMRTSWGYTHVARVFTAKGGFLIANTQEPKTIVELIFNRLTNKQLNSLPVFSEDLPELPTEKSIEKEYAMPDWKAGKIQAIEGTRDSLKTNAHNIHGTYLILEKTLAELGAAEDPIRREDFQGLLMSIRDSEFNVRKCTRTIRELEERISKERHDDAVAPLTLIKDDVDKSRQMVHDVLQKVRTLLTEVFLPNDISKLSTSPFWTEDIHQGAQRLQHTSIEHLARTLEGTPENAGKIFSETQVEYEDALEKLLLLSEAVAEVYGTGTKDGKDTPGEDMRKKMLFIRKDLEEGYALLRESASAIASDPSLAPEIAHILRESIS